MSAWQRHLQHFVDKQSHHCVHHSPDDPRCRHLVSHHETPRRLLPTLLPELVKYCHKQTDEKWRVSTMRFKSLFTQFFTGLAANEHRAQQVTTSTQVTALGTWVVHGIPAAPVATLYKQTSRGARGGQMFKWHRVVPINLCTHCFNDLRFKKPFKYRVEGLSVCTTCVGAGNLYF